jgi:predicted RNA binding protein YcfA (HicA-like mRNA interferase family)
VSYWPATKARRVLAALQRIGWVVKRQSGSHRTLSRPDWQDVVFAFHDDEELGPRILARIAKHTGLTPNSKGMVAGTSDPFAVHAGLEMLKRDGSAHSIPDP